MANNYSFNRHSCACSYHFLFVSRAYTSIPGKHKCISLDRHPLCRICAHPPLSRLRDLNSSDSIAIALIQMCYSNARVGIFMVFFFFLQMCANLWTCKFTFWENLCAYGTYVDTQSLTVKTIPLCLHSSFPGAPTAAPLSGEAGAPLHYALHCHGALCAGGHALGNHPGAQASLTQVHLEADLCWVWIPAKPKPHYLRCIWACVWESRCVTPAIHSCLA